MKNHSDDEYSPAETKRRMEDALRRTINMQPQPHKDMIGNGKRVSKG
jgi:hypothetical protein